MNPESQCLARDSLKTNPIKPEARGHVAEMSPELPHPAAVLPRAPSSQVSCFVSTCEPTLGPRRGCNVKRNSLTCSPTIGNKKDEQKRKLFSDPEQQAVWRFRG